MAPEGSPLGNRSQARTSNKNFWRNARFVISIKGRRVMLSDITFIVCKVFRMGDQARSVSFCCGFSIVRDKYMPKNQKYVRSGKLALLNGTAAAYYIRANYSYRVGFNGFLFKRLCDFLNIVEGATRFQ